MFVCYKCFFCGTNRIAKGIRSFSTRSRPLHLSFLLAETWDLYRHRLSSSRAPSSSPIVRSGILSLHYKHQLLSKLHTQNITCIHARHLHFVDFTQILLDFQFSHILSNTKYIGTYSDKEWRNEPYLRF